MVTIGFVAVSIEDSEQRCGLALATMKICLRNCCRQELWRDKLLFSVLVSRLKVLDSIQANILLIAAATVVQFAKC